MTDITIGADISKDHIDLYSLPGGQTLKVANDRKGFAAILKWIGAKGVQRIVFEPTVPTTGRSSVSWSCKAYRSPRSIRVCPDAFVKPQVSLPRRTGSMPHYLLSRYGALLEPRVLQAGTQTHSDLKELHMARLALIKDRTAAKNREKSLTNPLLKKHNSDRLRQIEHQIRAVDEAIMDLIAEDRPLKARFDILVSIPGVSQVTAFTLIIEMPELGELDEKAAPRSAVLPP